MSITIKYHSFSPKRADENWNGWRLKQDLEIMDSAMDFDSDSKEWQTLAKSELINVYYSGKPGKRTLKERRNYNRIN